MRKQKRVVIYIDDEQHRKLKSKLALLGESVSAWFRKVVERFVADP